jgi:Fe-S cluster biogenesis protein NfuA
MIVGMNTEDKVNAVLEKVRPYIQAHGGDVVLLNIQEETAFIKFQGSCASCPLANITYNNMIKPLLLEEVGEIKNIVIN